MPCPYYNGACIFAVKEGWKYLKDEDIKQGLKIDLSFKEFEERFCKGNEFVDCPVYLAVKLMKYVYIIEELTRRRYQEAKERENF